MGMATASVEEIEMTAAVVNGEQLVVGGQETTAGSQMRDADEPLLGQAESGTEDAVEKKPASGLNVLVVAVLIIADIAGGGIVALPHAFMKAGVLWGSVLMLVVCASFLYTAHLLGDSWLRMRRRWPVYRRFCRRPYAELARRSFGTGAFRFTSVIIQLMMFGVSVVYLILSARILSDLAASALNLKLSSCRMLVILALLFWPIIFFRSPADFWLIVVVAMGATFVASGVILVGAALDYPVCGPVARLPSFNLSESLLSLGVFMFSFGGHSVFINFQQDMKRAEHFTRASCLAFGVVFLLYGSITAMGVLTYGDGLADTIITSIQHASMRQWANLGIAVHCLLTLTITLNPLCQELEEALDVPHEFCFKRVAIRSGLLFSVTFTALSFPSFGAILNLIGGTTVALTSAVFPCLFNSSLRAFEHGGSVKKHGWLEMSRIIVSRTSWWRLLINGFIVVFATICGLVTTRSAIRELALATFSPPCYFATTHVLPTPHFVHCCGPHRNVSALLSNQCPS